MIEELNNTETEKTIAYAKEHKQELIECLEKALTQIVHPNKETSINDYFICNIDAITSNRKAKLWFKSQKPSNSINTKFSKYPFYEGDFVWWSRSEGGTYDEIVKEKKRFVRHLINKLKRRK